MTRAAVDQRFADREASSAPAISPDASLLRTCKNHIMIQKSISLFEKWREEDERAYFNLVIPIRGGGATLSVSLLKLGFRGCGSPRTPMVKNP